MTDTQQSTEPYIGEIATFSGEFVPRGWALCEGQPMPVRQHTALFSLVGTFYGGDGIVSFHLPDCRSLPAELAAQIAPAGAGDEATVRYCICLDGLYPTPERS